MLRLAGVAPRVPHGRRRICKQAGPALKQDGTFQLTVAGVQGHQLAAPSSLGSLRGGTSISVTLFCCSFWYAVLPSPGWPGRQDCCQGLDILEAELLMPGLPETQHKLSCVMPCLQKQAEAAKMEALEKQRAEVGSADT